MSSRTLSGISTSGGTTTINVSASAIPVSAIIQDRKSPLTQGGASVLGLNIRTLNSIIYSNLQGLSLTGGTTGVDGTANMLVVPPGTYHVRASCPGLASRHKVHLYNATTSSYILWGTGEYTPSVGVRSFCEGVITLETSSNLQLHHIFSVGKLLDGLGGSFQTSISGEPANVNEVYSMITLVKLA